MPRRSPHDIRLSAPQPGQRWHRRTVETGAYRLYAQRAPAFELAFVREVRPTPKGEIVFYRRDPLDLPATHSLLLTVFTREFKPGLPSSVHDRRERPALPGGARA